MDNTHKTSFTKALEKIEDIAPSGMILAVIVTLAFEGFFQYIFWGEMFPRLKDWHRCYAAGSIATFIGMFRLWFLVMSSRDIAAGNIRVALLGICASVGLMIYCIWECYHIGARWSSEVDKDTVIAMLIFTTCIVIVAEVRLMMSRYGSWRNSAQQAAEAIAEAEARAEAAEKRMAQAEAEVTAMKGLHMSELLAARSEADRALASVTSSLSEAEAAHARCRDYVAQVEGKLRQAEAEAAQALAEKQGVEQELSLCRTIAIQKEASILEISAELDSAKSELERLRSGMRTPEVPARNVNGTSGVRSNGSASVATSGSRNGVQVDPSGSNWPERLAAAFRKFREVQGRSPSPLELANAAGTSDKTERKYRSQYQRMI